MNIIYALLGAFSGLPTWTRWVFVVLSLAVTLGLSSFFESKVGIIITVGVVAVGCLVALLWAFVKRRREKRAAAFSGDLREQSGATPGGISDPARRARLEDLRKNFEKGVETFRAAGKNLYDVPWYVIVGEPGAGKTEAIRHSNVGFPPGMQDEFQGVGGTINMNWWFTNDAVILDTAGRLLFEEVEAGSTSEWRIFLEMLKKHRPNCPINGLLLAIPAESLVKDTPEQIQKKAGKIAQQLDTIQKKLDVRFPAYVVITKCDLLNGFREFFDNLTDPQAQHQMMGWSNPDPLDAPFNVNLVDEHIHEVVERLRRRRQGLMLDPVARIEQRRTDEVDRLFSLPHSVSLIAPNLRQYLQAIFIEGTWSVQPLFLRGIYFTSSLREGSALDQELASALGLDVEALPEGKAWERESSYFLRDVFIEKTFRERGLVTRATNTKQLVMKRRFMLLGTSVAAGLLLLGFSLLSSQSLKKRIGKEAGYWARAADFWDWQRDDDFRNDVMLSPIVKNEEGKPMEYAGDQPVGKGASPASKAYFSNDDRLLADFHKDLIDQAANPLHVSGIFHFAKQEVDIDKDRKRAQRVVFEDSVIKPLVDDTRQKMAPKLNASPAFEGRALVDLVRLEAAIVRRNESGTVTRPGTPVPLTGTNFLPPLSLYTTGREPEGKLAEMMDDLYSQIGAGARTWPPDWLSGGGSLSKNTAIESGLERFLNDANRVAKSQGDNLPLITLLIEELRKYARKEDELASACHVQPNAPIEKVDALVLSTYEAFKANKETLDAALRRAKEAGLFPDGKISLVAAYEWINREIEERYEIARALQIEANDLLAATQPAVVTTIKNLAGKNQDYTLFREIASRIKEVTELLEKIHSAGISAEKLAELKTLDEFHLTDAAGRVPHFDERWDLYQKALTASGKPPGYAETLDLIGKDWKELTDIYERVDQIRDAVDKYDGKLKEKTLEICSFCFARAKRQHSDEFCKAWVAKVDKAARAGLYFPFVWNPKNLKSLKDAETIQFGRLLDQIARDASSPASARIQSPLRQSVLDTAKRYSALTPIRKALLTPEYNLRGCITRILPDSKQRDLAGQNTGIEAYQAVQLRSGDISHGSVVKGASATPVSTKSGSETELGRFLLTQPFHFHFYKLLGDATWVDDHPAPTDWTALRLLDENTSNRIGDGKRWYVEERMPNRSAIWFALDFEEPLPAIADWPTRKTFDLDKAP